MMAGTMKIGLIIPSGGPEADYYGFEQAARGAVKLYFTISRVGGESSHDHDPDALRQTAQIEWLLDAALRLKPFGLNCVQWACTSGSFILGRAFAEKQAAALTEAMGAPATSTSLAFAAACQHFGLSKVGVLATYPPAAANHFVRFLGEFGIAVENLHCLHAPSGWDAAKFDEALITQSVGRVKGPGIGAVLIPDTALPSLHYLERLEQSVGMPVLTANAVTLWDAMRVAGRVISVDGQGGLLAGR